MNVSRRQFALTALAMGFLDVLPALATEADEDAIIVGKKVEAFWSAQIAADAKALDRTKLQPL